MTASHINIMCFTFLCNSSPLDCMIYTQTEKKPRTTTDVYKMSTENNVIIVIPKYFPFKGLQLTIND